MTVSDSYPTFVTAKGVVPNAAVPAAGLNVNSASFRTIDVRVTRLPFPTPTDTTAVAAVLTKTPEYQTTASTSATMMQPPQPGLPAKDEGSTAGTAVARSAGTFATAGKRHWEQRPTYIWVYKDRPMVAELAQIFAKGLLVEHHVEAGTYKEPVRQPVGMLGRTIASRRSYRIAPG
ncbi:MAG: hypothetical protein Q9184_002881 [Pyrenodesmia sp. 2 TL-2023]